MIPRRIWIFGSALFLLSAASLPAQRGRGTITNPIADNLGSSLVVHGSVAIPGEAAVGRLVLVEEICGGRTQTGVYGDSKGRFSFDLGVVDKSPGAKQNSPANLAQCSIRASLSGYRSEPVSLEEAVRKDKTDLGELTLQPIGKADAGRVSANDANVPANARRDYDKGLDAAAKLKWKEAIGALEKAASDYPQFATAWLNLGALQASQKDSDGALKSYARAIVADGKFAPPYIEAAVLEAGAGQWDRVIEHTSIAISLGPDSFARAYYLSAFANFMLKRGEAAKKSVAEGLRVDEDHEYPDLEYIDGILRMTYGDTAGARKQLQSYLDLAPNGANAANARQQLMDLPKTN